VPKPLTSGPYGWLLGQTPWLAGPTLYPLTGCLGSDALQEAVIRNLRPRVGKDRATWLAGYIVRPAIQHLACYQLNPVGNSSWDSYK
jgi:hypothetical protein